MLQTYCWCWLVVVSVGIVAYTARRVRVATTWVVHTGNPCLFLVGTTGHCTGLLWWLCPRFNLYNGPGSALLRLTVGVSTWDLLYGLVHGAGFVMVVAVF